MRIGLLCHRGVGGSVRIAIELGAALAAQGCAVHLFARSAPMGIDPPAGVKLHTILPKTDDSIVTTSLDLDWTQNAMEALVALVASVAETERLDVLHFHYAVPFADILARVRRRLARHTPALVGTLHGTDISLFGQRAASRLKLTASLASLDAITTVSANYAARAVRAFDLPIQPEVIPNFVDTGLFRPDGRTAPSGAPPMVLHVSNFRPVKQPDSMARIFVRVRSRLPATLGLIGDGSGMPSVRALLERAGLGHDLCCFGVQTAVETVLPSARVLVVTSREESFCLAALEAGASGVPVVAPRVGGLPEVVADGETGILFEPGDERQAADAVCRLLSDGALHAAMARVAVSRAQRFDTAAIVGRYLATYRRTLAQQRRRTLPASFG